MALVKLRLPETRNRRAIEFRIDRFGIYFLALEADPDWVYYTVDPDDDPFYYVNMLVAGITYQYPKWLMKLINPGLDLKSDISVVTNNFSVFNYSKGHDNA